MCLQKNVAFCADEGSYCHDGHHCCEYDVDMYCIHYVKRQSCTMHCPFCYTTVIGISYDKIATNGSTESFLIIGEKKFSGNLNAAEEYKGKFPVGCKRDCFVNPKDSHDVHYTQSYTWWKIVLVFCTILPAILNVALLFSEILLIFVLSGTRYLPLSSSDVSGHMNESSPLLSGRTSTSSEPLPLYEPDIALDPPKYEV
jgi:hypothetical protein